ncbi:hypothetical protein [uncultured Sulfitobacter sp.]|uniref:hypothetical protein n=1 Tax=uncultured Sulfitobacter sp. TaxID=191468 RepID=UPI00260B5D5B|nr:hypothetical protein [uncultured Sulfitobacter sp.]
MNAAALATTVLMVGHSLFGSDGPDMLQEALRAGTGAGDVRAQIINGAPLKFNWENSDTAEGVDARAVLPEGGVDHLILTEAIPLLNHTTWSDSEVYAQAFFGLAAAANPDVQVYVQETWHSMNSGTGVAVAHDDGADVPWRARLEADLPVWEGIVAAVAAGNAHSTAGITLIPAGQAMALLHDEIAAGSVPGLSDISALFSDDIHLNDTGHYFVTMVQYAVITGQNPLGLPRDFSDRYGNGFDLPEADLARDLQRLAWAAVVAYQARVPRAPVTPARKAQADPATPRAPPLDIAALPASSVPGTNRLAIGLAGVADWSVQQPFLNVLKSARPWVGHTPGQWGGMEEEALRAGGYLDANGVPVKKPTTVGSIGTLVLTDLPEAAQTLAGRYVLRYTGKGVVEVTGRATAVRYGPGTVTFDYTPGPGSVDIRIQRMHQSDPLRLVSVVKQDHEAAFNDGAVFNPDWTARLQGFDGLRFMDWMATNDATLARWEDRPLPADMTYARGVPVEVMVELANELQADPWFTLPHLADDAFVRRFATTVRDRLDPGLKAHVEYSNEVWNWQFEQTVWADAQATARWGRKDSGVQFYALRAAEVARIWTEVFGAEAEARLVNVISSQTGWLGLEQDIFDAPLVVAEGGAAPHTAFDAYAITGYFGGILGSEGRRSMVARWLADSLAKAEEAAVSEGLSGEAAAAYVAKHRFDYASALAGRELRDGGVTGDPTDTVAGLITKVWPYHAAKAEEYGLDLIMYEGGSHVVGLGALVDDAALTTFFQHFNYTPEMGALYATMLEGWKAQGGQLFNAYLDVYAPTKWGSWGALRHPGDKNPRWDALRAFQ